MSIANFLRSSTQDENWSKVYFNEVNADVLNIDTLNVDNLIAKTALLGTSPNQYFMPGPVAPPDVGQVPVLTAVNALTFTTLRRSTVQFGGSMDASPRFLIVSGSPGIAASTSADINSQFKAPYLMRLTHLTYVTQSGNTTSSWNIYNGAGIVHTFTFPANGVYPLPTSLTWAAGETMSISWLGVGTQPDSTGMTAFFNQVE